jgi:hypothetical protein
VASRTQHGPLLILHAPLLPNVVGNGQEDGHVFFGGVLARVESPHNGKTRAAMDVKGSAGKVGLDRGKGEVLARHVAGA